MSDYDKQKWVKLYRTALLELEHAKMADRIRDTRIEIAARIEKLRDIPGLHVQERQAIEDALNSNVGTRRGAPCSRRPSYSRIRD